MSGSLTRQSLQTRSSHSLQRSPRPKIRPKDLRQRAHCRSPISRGRGEPLRLISSNSFFSLLLDRKRRPSGNIKKESAASIGGTKVLTVSSSPLASAVSHLSATPSGSSPFHAPAERRDSDPLQPDPLVPQSKLCQQIQPSCCMKGSQKPLHHVTSCVPLCVMPC